MKKKSILTGMALVLCMSFGQAALAKEDPTPGYPEPPRTCKAYPCPIAP
ncbi:hypothetical protein ACFOZY_00950 [Chungangia koreensis]|uniref:Uncharacterized protein n=1 Tax=Chungangia koreensis TaxID=752657 RepID=A0ABV8X1K4_9LACT